MQFDLTRQELELKKREQVERSKKKDEAAKRQEKIRNELQGARFFSVLADGSTDSGIIEQESVLVRYTGPGGAPKTQFADLVDATSGDAKG